MALLPNSDTTRLDAWTALMAAGASMLVGVLIGLAPALFAVRRDLIEAGQIASSGERAVLERLQDRRKELDTRSRELEMRENLLKATEKRLDAKVAELKDAETRINTAMGNRDKAEAERFKSIVAMYENMKSKDAARILERLDMKILVEVATKINPRKMSEILAQMTPEAAERLTVELARRADPQPQSPDQLPKIEGKPNGT